MPSTNVHFFATNVKNKEYSNTYLILFTYLCHINLNYNAKIAQAIF